MTNKKGQLFLLASVIIVITVLSLAFIGNRVYGIIEFNSEERLAKEFHREISAITEYGMHTDLTSEETFGLIEEYTYNFIVERYDYGEEWYVGIKSQEKEVCFLKSEYESGKQIGDIDGSIHFKNYMLDATIKGLEDRYIEEEGLEFTGCIILTMIYNKDENIFIYMN